jgi:hypothetical protein
MGYKNLVPQDRPVHRDSGRGIKQPQLKTGMTVISRFTNDKGQVVSTNPFTVKYRHGREVHNRFSNPKFWQKTELKDSDRDGVPNVIDCDPNDPMKQDEKPSKFRETLGKVGRFAVDEVKLGYKKGKQYLDEQKKAREKKRMQELRIIKNPEVMAVEKQRERIEEIKKEIDDPASDFGQQSRLIRELENERDQLRQLQEKATKVNLEDLNDKDLETLAIRHTDGFLSRNQYESELLRRISYRQKLARKEREAARPRQKN